MTPPDPAELEELGQKVLERERELAPVRRAPEDNWKHRSKGMRCQTCMFFVPKVASDHDGPSMVGRCRRHAPTMSGWPVMFTQDWCGDHKLDENKLSDG